MASSPSVPRNDDEKLRATLSTSILLLPVLMLALLSGSAQAAPADAREEARLNNCPPKKVEVVSHTLGEAGQTLYRVECALPKIKESEGANAAGAPDAVLIQCSGAICALLRPVKTAK